MGSLVGSMLVIQLLPLTPIHIHCVYYLMSQPPAISHLDPTQLHIRPAEPEDVLPCSLLEGGYQTDYVWQMHLQENERLVQTIFNRVRLPRTMPVAYPYSETELKTIFEQADLLLVACYGAEIVGCLEGQFDSLQKVLTINNLIVNTAVRGQKIGKRLLNGARIIAEQHNCQMLNITLQTKNNPTIRFVQKLGFAYAGYNDKLYLNGDIALIFSLKL